MNREAYLWFSSLLPLMTSSGCFALQVSGVGYNGKGSVYLLPSKEVIKEFSNVSVGKLVEVSVQSLVGVCALSMGLIGMLSGRRDQQLGLLILGNDWATPGIRPSQC